MVGIPELVEKYLIPAGIVFKMAVDQDYTTFWV